VNTVRLLRGSIRRNAAANTRDVLLITLLCSTAALSIFYFPDFIHIAFISPLFFVAISENAERLLRLPVAAARRAIDVVVPTLAAILLVVTVVRLVDNQARLRERFANIRETRFGRVAFATAREAALHDALERRLASASKRDIFTYPGFLNLYLTVGARNPTRFQFFLPGYNSPDQVASVLRDLEQAKPPYVIVTSPQWLADDDPVLKYLRQHYALDSDSESDKLSLIYRRISPPSAP